MVTKKPQSVEVPTDGPVMMPSAMSVPDLGAAPIPALPPDSATQADFIPSIVSGAMKEAQTPSLKPQGPSNPILKLFSRAAGQSADTPEPGELYKGPTTGEEKRANLGKYLSGLQGGLAEAAAPFGTPEQKTYAMELPEKKREVQAANELKEATLGVTNAYHQGQLANAADKIDVGRQKDVAAMRMRGEVPDESGSGYRAMNLEEMQADPVISQNRDLLTAKINAQKAQAELANARRDALVNPQSQTQKNKLQELETKAKQAEGYLAMARQRLNLATTRVGIAGYNAMMNTGMDPTTGEFLDEAQARGAAPATFADNNGKPVPYKMQTAFIPTSSMRTQQQMAETIEPMIPSIQNDVQRLASKIGPGAGRWNDFWVNHGGTNDPDYAALNTDLSLFATALGKAHFGSRIPQGFVEDMLRQFSEAQSPENLIERLTHADNWVAGYAAFHAKQTAPHTTGGGGENVIEYEKGADGQYHPKQKTTVH